MKIESKLFDDVAVLSLVGELDSRGHQQLDKTLKDLIEGRIYKLVLDLSVIRFMGQKTIGLLISHMKELRANGGDIRFLNPQRALMQYLKQNRVIELFQVFSTRAEALDSYKVNPAFSPSSSPKAGTAESFSPQPAASPSQNRSHAPGATDSIDTDSSLKTRFETGEILYANSCMLATLIKMLEAKGMLSSEEAGDLMDYERLSLKGVDE